MACCSAPGWGCIWAASGVSALRIVYLVLAVAGAAFGVSALISGGWWFVNGAPRPDIAVASAALALWAMAETWVRGNWLALVALPATFFLGVGCGLPLYLFLRTKGVN